MAEAWDKKPQLKFDRTIWTEHLAWRFRIKKVGAFCPDQPSSWGSMQHIGREKRRNMDQTRLVALRMVCCSEPMKEILFPRKTPNVRCLIGSCRALFGLSPCHFLLSHFCRPLSLGWSPGVCLYARKPAILLLAKRLSQP